VQYTHEENGITATACHRMRDNPIHSIQQPGRHAIWALDDNAAAGILCWIAQSRMQFTALVSRWQRFAYERLDDATEALVPRFSIWWLDISTGETRPAFQDEAFASTLRSSLRRRMAELHLQRGQHSHPVQPRGR